MNWHWTIGSLPGMQRLDMDQQTRVYHRVVPWGDWLFHVGVGAALLAAIGWLFGDAVVGVIGLGLGYWLGRLILINRRKMELNEAASQWIDAALQRAGVGRDELSQLDNKDEIWFEVEEQYLDDPAFESRQLSRVGSVIGAALGFALSLVFLIGTWVDPITPAAGTSHFGAWLIVVLPGCVVCGLVFGGMIGNWVRRRSQQT